MNITRSIARSCLLMGVLISAVPILVAGGQAHRESPVSTPLTLRIIPQAGVVTNEKTLPVRFELKNAGRRPITVCKWPGVAFYGGWDMPDGTRQGFGPGYPSTRQLERGDFISLQPGQLFSGVQDVQVFPTPAGTIDLRGEYRSGQNGSEFGLDAYVGEVMSGAVTIRVPKQ